MVPESSSDIRSTSQLVELVLNTLSIFQEIADHSQLYEPCRDLRVFYIYLNAALLKLKLNRSSQPLYEPESVRELENMAVLVLYKLSSSLRSSVVPDYETSLPSSTPYPRLRALGHYWRLSAPSEGKILHVKQCLDLSSQKRRNKLLQLVGDWVNIALSQQSGQSTEEAEEYLAPRNKRWKTPRSVQNAATSVCEALVACSRDCSCIPNHDYAARLRLATHRKHADDDHSFETFLTMDVAVHPWQEALIQVIAPDPPRQLQPTVTFKVRPEDDASRAMPRPSPVLVKHLCEQLAKMKQQPLMRMNLKVENEKLWKEKSLETGLRISRSQPSLSLEDLMREFSARLSDRCTRVLGVLISYSILHLRGTPWLHAGSLRASNILFFWSAGALPLKPYIHMKLRDCGHGASSSADEVDTEPDPDDVPLHSCPELTHLAIILMELHTKQPIRDLAEQAGMALPDWDNISDNTRLVVAEEVFKLFKDEFPDKYRWSVGKCLDPNIGLDQNNHELDDHGLKHTIYDNIIGPLEDELEDIFRQTVSVDSLDAVAPTLNLCAWGQPYRVQSPPNTTHAPGTVHSRMSDRTSGFLQHQDYTVGWICALSLEMAASEAMLDDCHAHLPQDPRDANSYCLGRIGAHNVVMACLPAGVTGITSAARVAEWMKFTFKHIRFVLMVGIGGGAPGSRDIRLGDIVVGTPGDRSGGIIQYDFGKSVENGQFLHTGSVNRPPDVILNAVSRLQSRHFRTEPLLNHHLETMIQQHPKMKDSFSHPGATTDLLFNLTYDHKRDKDGSNSCSDNCDSTQLVHRDPRSSTSPHIHYGLIASANQVMRDGATRERLRKQHNVLCFEMEAAGLADSVNCLVIRGICDYADSHKGKTWQEYAAATAAAYAKELLGVVSSGS